MADPVTSPQRKCLWLGLPSGVLAILAIGFAIYGSWIQPRHLKDQYVKLLADHRTTYQTATETSDSEFIELGTTIELCYSRLEPMDTTYQNCWERVQFWGEHIEGLRRRVYDYSVPSDELHLQLTYFEELYYRTLSEMPPGSPHEREALLALANFHQISHDDTVGLGTLANRLKTWLEIHPLDDEIRITLAQINVRGTWLESMSRAELSAERLVLSDALNLLQSVSNEYSFQRDALTLEILCQLNVPEGLVLADSVKSFRPQDEHQLKFAILQLAVKGEWHQLQLVLANNLLVVPPYRQSQFLNEIAAGLVHLLVSDLSKLDAAWCSSAPNAVQFLLAINESSLDFIAFLWQAALTHAGAAHSVSNDLIEAILISDAQEVADLVLAISQAICENSSKIQVYGAYAKRDDFVRRLAKVSLWYIQRDKKYSKAWLSLLLPITEQNGDGVAWFAIGALQASEGQYQDSYQSLTRAKERLGNISSIQGMLDSVEHAVQLRRSSKSSTE